MEHIRRESIGGPAMKHATCILLAALASAFVSPAFAGESVDALVRRLSSVNFRDRDLADKALRGRLEVAPALRLAAQSKDVELARRAFEIIDFIERRPLRELDSAIANGELNLAIEILCALPIGKYDAEMWSAVLRMTRQFTDRHVQKGGRTIELTPALFMGLPHVVKEKPITEITPIMSPGQPLLITDKVDVDYKRTPLSKSKNRSLHRSCPFFVCTGTVRVQVDTSANMAIFASGDVHLGQGLSNCLVISSGDVSWDDCVRHSLIIARGKINVGNEVMNSRLISGKSIITPANNKFAVRNSLLTEHELCPLGYVRWAKLSDDSKILKQ
jgi:hypothetical protein